MSRESARICWASLLGDQNPAIPHTIELRIHESKGWVLTALFINAIAQNIGSFDHLKNVVTIAGTEIASGA